MGTYLNPGNSGFAEILKTDYVDKTGLISLINSTIETKKKLTCISRPRRFGKSYAAQMLCAYYDKTCDSHALFADYAIAGEKSYGNYINQYDVIYWDMTGIKPYMSSYPDVVCGLYVVCVLYLASAVYDSKQNQVSPYGLSCVLGYTMSAPSHECIFCKCMLS